MTTGDPSGVLTFGTFSRLGLEQQRRIAEYLRLAWQAQHGQDIRTLGVDLELLAPLYAPAIQAKKLRAKAETLRPVAIRRPPIERALYIPVDNRSGLVTPEGRLLLEVTRSGERVEPTPDELEVLVDFYAAPRRIWMEKTFSGGDLRPATLGFVVFLLFNGSIGPERALLVPETEQDERRVAEAVIPVVNAFSLGIGGSPLERREATRLRSNWAVTEARRQMPGVVRRGARTPANIESVFIAPGAEAAAVVAVARNLAGRSQVDVAGLDRALDDTIGAYANARPLLKAWGLSFESEDRTRSVRQALRAEYQAVVE